ncbi:hypothetical protein [Tumebacillus flagellatus]|uniref:Lipoprotein n=1 Tax=Tumebacillus flagellatus TaxID=1157490 RepID=A0A074LSX3_9BACL|nr:hypothetical protein [Tumebacillus flagellatus]KEO85276.1 hypothetical protein EL26_01580 [Tumebacillus flagellatus]
MKRFRFVIFSVFLTICLSGCSAAKVTQLNTGMPSQAQLNAYLEQNNIRPLDIATLQNSYLVIYQTDYEVGTYGIYLDSNGKINSWHTSSQFTPGHAAPVHVSYSAGDKAYAIVIINDEKVRNAAKKIVVQFSNGQTETAAKADKIGYIIQAVTPDKDTKFKSVSVVDANGANLYEMTDQ